MPKHLDHISTKLLLTISFVLLAIVVVLIKFNFKPSQLIQAAWFDDNYTYRQTITITHNANIFDNRAIGVSVSTSGLVSAGKMQSDCDDTRFTDPSGKVLPYQLVSGCNGTNTQYTVVVPKVNNGTNYIHVYYGNPSATSNSQDVSGYTSLAPSTPGPAAASEEVGGGPIAYWKMDEGVGTTIYDSSSQNNFGTLGPGSSAPSWQIENSCKIGKCLSLDGTNDYASIPDNNSIDFTPSQDFTVSFWVKDGGGNANQDSIVEKWNNSGSYPYVFRFSNTSSVNFTRYDGTNSPTVFGSVAITGGNWFHVEGVKNGSTMYLYVNGSQIGSTLDTTSGTTTNTSPLYLGAKGGTTAFYAGNIDDLKIYNYARTSTQVLADYNSRGSIHGSSSNLGVATTDTGPIAYWSFEEGTGTTAYDTGSSTFNAVIGPGTSAPTWTVGKYGHGLKFDGINDKVVPTQPTTITTNLTMEAWINPSVLPQTDGMVINNGTDSAGYGFSVGGAGGSNSKLYMIFNAIVWFDTGYVFPTANTWYHIATTRDTTTWRVYVNGVQTPSTHTQNPNTPTASNFEIGHEPQYNGRFFNGIIDEVKFYNYARTQKQIISDMNGGHPAGGSPVGSQLGYWKFDEGIGGTAFNTGSVGSTINANLQTGTSSPTWSTNGVYNKALSFDGNDYLSVPETGDLRFPTTAENYTLSAWVKRSSVGTTQYILSKEDSDNDGWRLLFDGANTITCSIGATDVTSTLTVTDTTTWHHIACAMDRAGTGQVYLDGKPASLATSIAGQVLNTTTALTIGARSYTPTHFFNGLIDEVKIYASQLTASEILIDYNRGQALVLGSSSSDVGGTSFSNSVSRSYCVPGDSSTCSTPAAQWLFQEGTGTTAYDTSGNNYFGIITGAAYVPGKNGTAIYFDGVSNNYVGITGVDPYQTPTNQWSQSAWIYPQSGGDANKVIFSQHNNVESGFYLETSNNYLHSNWRTTTTSIGFSAGTVANNTWSYVATIYDGTNVIHYINGIMVGSTNPGQTLSFRNNDANKVIGYNQAGGSHFKGMIDDFRIYQYARTPAQIAWEYNQGKPIVQFKLDECQGTTVYDSMGTGYTGTWSGSGGGSQTSTGSCTTNAATGWYNGRNGKINSSMNFDGTDDYINFGDNTTLGIGASNTTMTMSAWIYPTTLSGSNLIIIRKRGVNVGYQAYINGGTLSIHIGNQSSFSLTASDYLTTNAWNLFTVVADGTNHILYINGKNVASVASSTTINDSTGNNLVVGGNPGYFPGQIDDFRLYNYALTPAQVQMLYNSNTSVNFAPVTGTP